MVPISKKNALDSSYGTFRRNYLSSTEIAYRQAIPVTGDTFSATKGRIGSATLNRRDRLGTGDPNRLCLPLSISIVENLDFGSPVHAIV